MGQPRAAPRTCKIRRHNPEGDMLFITGKVTGKRVEDGRHLVDIEQAGGQPGRRALGAGHRHRRAADAPISARANKSHEEERPCGGSGRSDF